MDKTLEDIIKEKKKWDKYYEDSAKRRQNKISKEEYLAEWGMEDNWKDDIEYYNSLVKIIKAEDLKRMVELIKNIEKLIKEYHS